MSRFDDLNVSDRTKIARATACHLWEYLPVNIGPKTRHAVLFEFARLWARHCPDDLLDDLIHDLQALIVIAQEGDHIEEEVG